MTGFRLPDYEGACITNVLPSVADRLAGRSPALGVPKARKYVVLLVDGFGWHQVRQYREHCEFVAHHLGGGKLLSTSVPSTTATALSCLGCGVPPGQHGVPGYSFFEPGVGAVVNALTWERGPEDVAGFRQVPTVFEELTVGGCACAAVTLARFENSAATRIAFGGTTFFPITAEGDVEEVVGLTARALQDHDVVYCYKRLLDYAGHGHGVGSWQWLEQLAAADDLVAALAGLSSPEVCLLVTGDHGMINVPHDRRVVAEEHGLADGVLLGGEGRMRQVYGDDPAAIAARWSRVLGERALVLRRQEAIDAGWFGPVVTPRSAARIGDVLVAMREDWAVMSTAFPRELSLVGMHGSLTPEEMEIPLLMFGGLA
ncbi:MAG TPA: alkaline phosphatase family protein [Arachnia sp.]|nr:alkaline phosphatase family protein [Arachnia sp.]HMT86011.1 alkaline phosphatase family protein [Arachnia sp.]